MRIQNASSKEPPGDRSGRLPPRNYFARPVQYQMLALVFCLMLVLVLMREAAKPQNWTWLWQNDAPAVAAQPWHQAVDAESDIDTRIGQPRPAPHASFPDAMTITPAPEPRPDVTTVPGYFPGVNPEHLAGLRDDTLFRRREQTVWYELLELLARTPASELASFPPEPVGFVQLYRQPEVYRGKLVSIEGSVRRAHYITDSGTRPAVPGYWQCWLRPRGSTNPVVVYALQMPADFPSGTAINEHVQFTGFFLKRWAYLSRDSPRTAPLILAKQGDWQPPVASDRVQLPSLRNVVLAALAMAILAMVIVCWIGLSTSRKATASSRRGQATPSGLESIEVTELPIGPPHDESHEGSI